MRIREATAGDAPAIRDIYNDAVAHTTAIWNETLVDAADRAAWIETHASAGRPVLVAVSAPTHPTCSAKPTYPADLAKHAQQADQTAQIAQIDRTAPADLAAPTGRTAMPSPSQTPAEPAARAESDGAVLGYAAYGEWRAFDGYRLSAEHSVYVRKDARGQGVGAALLRALIERARTAGLHVLVAAISGDNAGSIRLHERLGFVRVGRMPEVGVKFGRWLDLELLQLVLDGRRRPE